MFKKLLENTLWIKLFQNTFEKLKFSTSITSCLYNDNVYLDFCLSYHS